MKIRYVCVLFDQMFTCMSICATFYVPPPIDKDYYYYYYFKEQK